MASFREEGKPHTSLIFTDDMYFASDSIQCDNIYGVGDQDVGDKAAKPFIQTVHLLGPHGECVELEATFDDGASVNAIDNTIFAEVQAQLSEPTISPRVLRMANGISIPSGGSWRGKITVGRLTAGGTFEILPSGGVWQMLLGKPMLKAFAASHEYVHDTVTLRTEEGTVMLENELEANAEGLR